MLKLYDRLKQMHTPLSFPAPEERSLKPYTEKEIQFHLSQSGEENKRFISNAMHSDTMSNNSSHHFHH